MRERIISISQDWAAMFIQMLLVRIEQNLENMIEVYWILSIGKPNYRLKRLT